MNLRDLNYELELPDAMVKPFEKKVLESGLCDFAVPMSFFCHSGKQKIRYECSGYVALSEVDLTEIPTAFEIIEKTLLALKKSGEYLIDPNKVLLNQDTVYVHHSHMDVRIAYVPGICEESSGRRNLIEFFRIIEKRIPLAGNIYLKKLMEETIVNNRSLQDLITIIGEMRREIFLCQAQLNQEP